MFAFIRGNLDQNMLFITNFCEHKISLISDFITDIYGSGYTLIDLWSDKTYHKFIITRL